MKDITQTPSTHSQVLWKTETFSSEYGYHPHVTGVFGHQKRRFSNTLSRVESFENGDSSYSCGRAKTEVFKYDDVMTTFKARSSAHTIRKRNVWTEIFLNTEEKISVFENTRLRVDKASDMWIYRARNYLDPVHASKTGMFFSEYGYRPHVSGVFWHWKRRFSNTLSRVETYRIRVDGRKQRFSNTMTSCLGSRLALRHNYDSKDADLFKYGGKSLRFQKYPATYGRSNTIRKRYVWTQVFLNTEKKISVFENTRLRADRALRWIKFRSIAIHFHLAIYDPKFWFMGHVTTI